MLSDDELCRVLEMSAKRITDLNNALYWIAAVMAMDFTHSQKCLRITQLLRAAGYAHGK